MKRVILIGIIVLFFASFKLHSRQIFNGFLAEVALEKIGPKEGIPYVPYVEKAASPMPCGGANDEIGGTVFLDHNNNGSNDAEDGQQGIIVSIFDCDGNEVTGSPVTTDANGDWSITGLLNGERYRVEFSLPNSLGLLHSSFAGDDNGTSTQSVTVPSCSINYGVIDPAIYCENPQIVTNCYDRFGLDTPQDVLISVDFESPSSVNHESQNNQIGATYGLAYQQSSNILFAASFMKRFSPFGPSGPGAIYQVTDPVDGNYSGSLFVDLNVLFGSNVAGSDPHDFVTAGPTGDILDAASFDAVGRVSFGDLDIALGNTPTEQDVLYVVNLADRSLYSIPLGPDKGNPTPPQTHQQNS